MAASREVAPSETYSYFVLRNIVAQLAAHQPLVLFFDDVQWLDESSVRFLAYLIQELPALKAPVCILLAARTNGKEKPGVAAVRNVLSRDHSHGREFVLPPLEGDEVLTAAEKVLGAPSAFTEKEIEWLRLTSGGNPKYLSEVLLLLRERGTVELVQHRWRFAGPAADIVVPPSLRDVIADRLSQLPPFSREILGYAAVFGRQFDVNAVARAARAEVRPVIDAFSAAESTVGCIKRIDVEEFEFDHDLTREAILHVLGHVAAGMHRRVASILEDDHAPAVRVAYHRRAGGQYEDAARCYATAAADAFERAAYTEAAACARQEDALLQEAGVSVDSPDRLHAVTSVAESLIAAELYADAVEFLRPRLLEAEGYDRAMLDHLFGRAAIRLGRAEIHREAVAALESAFAGAAPGPRSRRIQIMTDLVYAFDAVGEYDKSKEMYRRAYIEAAEHQNVDRALLVRLLRLSCIFFQPEKVIEMIGQGIQLASADHLPYETALCENNLGNAYFHLHALDRAETLFERARAALAAFGGHRVDTPINNLGLLALVRGDAAGAERLLAEALNRSADPHSRLFIRSNLAVAAAVQGRLAEAIDALAPLVEDADATGDLFYAGTARYNLAQALLAAGEPDDAITVLRGCAPHHVTTDSALVVSKRANLLVRAIRASGREPEPLLHEQAAWLRQTTKPQAWLYRYEWELSDIEFWED
jgi:tetratricopeptide (TPR) repeat protein